MASRDSQARRSRSGAPGRTHGRQLAAACSVVALFAATARASSEVSGTTRTFESPGGISERCVVLDRVPGGRYTADDGAREAAYCSIDFHGSTHALCPKVFSTSPGTLIYDLAGGPYAGNRVGFETNACIAGGINDEDAVAEPLSFKVSVNTPDTSATFANSSLIYYHFSRYFDTTVHVPPSVLRTIDRSEHGKRVSARGVELSADRSALRMNHAAWLALQAAERDPSSYRPTSDLFSPDGQLYGVLLHPIGQRYGAEINGTRASGWGDGQNRDFQETAPFRALRSAQPLPEAIVEGRRIAGRDPELARATGSDVSDAQMVYWMSDLIDITLLDYLFSQQDRVGNIDYVPYWHWLEDGALQRERARGTTLPASLEGKNAIYLKRTELGDNDAGARTSYANFAKRTGMLEKLRHYRADTYRQLLRLDEDLARQGPLYDYARATFGLSTRELAQFVNNTSLAAGILRASCLAGDLIFDVDAERFLISGGRAEAVVLDCENP